MKAKEPKLTKTEMKVLKYCAEQGFVPHARITIADELKLDQITVSNAIGRLEQLGYIEQVSN